MTVDLLSATFFSREDTFPGRVPAGSEAAGDPPDEADADAEARREGFWSAMLRSLWPSAENPPSP